RQSLPSPPHAWRVPWLLVGGSPPQGGELATTGAARYRPGDGRGGGTAKIRSRTRCCRRSTGKHACELCRGIYLRAPEPPRPGGHAGTRRARAEAREIRRMLLPALGEKPISEITAQDVRVVFDRLKVHAPFDARNAWGT